MTLQRRFIRTVLGFGALTGLTLLLTPLVGPTSINLQRVFNFSIPFADNVDAQIFFVARLPRTLAGACVGALFASAGVVFQGLLRNPLATPFTLGVSTGAALGAVLAITFNLSLAFLGISAVPVAAFAGSLMAVAIVYALAQARHRGLSTTAVWYSPRSPQGSMPRAAKISFMPALSGRPSHVLSSHGSRTVTMSARVPEATNASKSVLVEMPNSGSTAVTPASAHRASAHSRCSGYTRSPNTTCVTPSRASARTASVKASLYVDQLQRAVTDRRPSRAACAAISSGLSP